jgi:hypothetical protein
VLDAGQVDPDVQRVAAERDHDAVVVGHAVLVDLAGHDSVLGVVACCEPRDTHGSEPRACPKGFARRERCPGACDGKAEEGRRGSAALTDENAASARTGQRAAEHEPLGRP